MPLTYNAARTKADKLAREKGRDYFVIRESGEYHVANDFDLDSFFLGISDDSILYCTGDY